MSQGEIPALQKRSQESRDKIVRALDEALREKPFDQLSVAEIAQRAGVAVGTVYQRFKNKEALIPVVLEIYKSRVEQWMQGYGRLEIAEDDGLHAALKKLFRQAWNLCKREAHLLKTVHLHVRLKPDLANDKQWQQFEQASARSVRVLIDHFADELSGVNIDRAATFAAYFFNAIMIEKALYPDEPPATLFKQRGTAFADECADMLYAYLVLER